ncbi:MAG: hypothetical protein K1060chlam1_01175 [Candidatus Anoxychlamydiales bacterium]|nr:hypothetical protein [Candidatus Anoxychlamydiales bacterium]
MRMNRIKEFEIVEKIFNAKFLLFILGSLLIVGEVPASLSGNNSLHKDAPVVRFDQSKQGYEYTRAYAATVGNGKKTIENVEQAYRLGCKYSEAAIRAFDETGNFASPGVNLDYAIQGFSAVQKLSPEYYELCYKQHALCCVFKLMSKFRKIGYSGIKNALHDHELNQLCNDLEKALLIDEDCALAYFYRACCLTKLSFGNDLKWPDIRYSIYQDSDTFIDLVTGEQRYLVHSCSLAIKDFERFMELVDLTQWEPFSWQWEACYIYALCLHQSDDLKDNLDRITQEAKNAYHSRDRVSVLKNSVKKNNSSCNNFLIQGPNKEKITEYLKIAAKNGVVGAQEILRKNIISW